jgi:hypothetical protein
MTTPIVIETRRNGNPVAGPETGAQTTPAPASADSVW